MLEWKQVRRLVDVLVDKMVDVKAEKWANLLVGVMEH
jgi:hypothetical protein